MTDRGKYIQFVQLLVKITWVLLNIMGSLQIPIGIIFNFQREKDFLWKICSVIFFYFIFFKLLLKYFDIENKKARWCMWLNAGHNKYSQTFLKIWCGILFLLNLNRIMNGSKSSKVTSNIKSVLGEEMYREFYEFCWYKTNSIPYFLKLIFSLSSLYPTRKKIN